ncbi:MAG TPA: HIT family protein [Thermoanaerobaculia bacterium]|nr:HIT family protein [Thermoanaerobaculia bacterium]
MTCVFCTNPREAGDVVYEDARAWVLLHPDWSPRGHAMVVAKTHVENASQLSDEEWLHLARVWHRAERVLLDLTGQERAIILKLGIATPHLHLHIYPMSARATREEMFDAIDGKHRENRDDDFVSNVTTRLDTSAATE